MFLVGFVLFSEGNFPLILVERREVSIGFLRSIVDFCQAEPICEWKSLCINACSTNDINVFVCRTTSKSIW